jgi:hypothetical protein
MDESKYSRQTRDEQEENRMLSYYIGGEAI